MDTIRFFTSDIFTQKCHDSARNSIDYGKSIESMHNGIRIYRCTTYSILALYYIVGMFLHLDTLIDYFVNMFRQSQMQALVCALCLMFRT